jgi:hypothetical protein
MTGLGSATEDEDEEDDEMFQTLASRTHQKRRRQPDREDELRSVVRRQLSGGEPAPHAVQGVQEEEERPEEDDHDVGTVITVNGQGQHVAWIGGKGGCTMEQCAGVTKAIRQKHKKGAKNVGLHIGCCRGYPGIPGGIGKACGRDKEGGHSPNCVTILAEIA